MPKVLEESEIDLANEEVNAQIDLAEESRAFNPITRDQVVQDLSDGGMVNGVRVTPMQDGRRVQKGRAVVRQAWMWNGTESFLPLGWNPEGTQHNGARPYLLKRHCLCCNVSGFKGRQCPACVRNGCSRCASSTDTRHETTLASGRVLRGWIIPNFYLRKDDVPFPERFYGNVPCFLTSCPRHGGMGFKTEQDMRMHARSRHRMEYQSYMEAERGQETTKVDALQRQVNALLLAQVKPAASDKPQQRRTSRKRTPTKATIQ